MLIARISVVLTLQALFTKRRKDWLRGERAEGAGRLRERLLVVGNGMVGQRLCERLVEGGATTRYEILVLSEESVPAYDRVHLSDVLVGRAAHELLLREYDWYVKNGIELRLGTRVASLDLAMRMLHPESGRPLSYAKLVLATGSKATVPSIPLADGAEIIPYRTLEDAERLLASVRDSQRRDRTVAVVGGGLLGVEAARAFQRLGCRVVVLEASSQLLPRQLDPFAAEVLSRTLLESGLEIRLRCRVERVARSADGSVVVLGDGETMAVGAVVAAAGARASDELAKAAGLRCHPRGGVEVDAQLRTSDPHVFAVGECASHQAVPHGLVAPGYAMADVLAANLVGKRATLGPQSAVTRLKLDLTEVTVLGDPIRAPSQADLTFATANVYRRLLVARNRVVAAISVGAWSELAQLQAMVDRRRALSRKALARFSSEGQLGIDAGDCDPACLPSSAVVCQCANVTCGELRQALSVAPMDADSLSRATGASTLCGSCRPTLIRLCGVGAAAQEKQRILPRAAAVALSAVVATVLLPRFPLATSVLEQGMDALYTSTSLKRATGFALVVFVMLGLMFSLRKRVSAFRFSNYRTLRIVHGVLGVIALAGLFLHTGFRLGVNLNLILMSVFLASSTTGALAAILPAGSSPRFERVRAFFRRTHEVSFWPLPVLIFFHALKSYYF